MSRTLRIALFSSLTLAAAACGNSPASIANTLVGNAASGKTVYQSDCISCHGSDGASGSARKPVAALAQSNPEQAISVVLAGDGEMPAWSGVLTDQQIADVVAYLKTL